MKATMILAAFYVVTAFADKHFIDSNNNAFGDFSLGRGFDSSQGKLKETHAFREGTITYDFMPITKTTTKCVTIQSARDMAEQLDIYGELSLSYKGISGSGFLQFNRGEEQMERNAYFKCTVDRTLFTTTVNTDDVYPTAQQIADGENNSDLLNPAVVALSTADEKRALIGDKYVSAVTYGRRYEVEIKVSYSKQNTWDQIQGGVKASIGLGFLEVSAEIKMNMEKSNYAEDMKMTLTSTSIGFVEATPVKFPEAVKCSGGQDGDLEVTVDVSASGRRLLQDTDCPTDQQISVGEQMQDMIQQNIDAMNDMDSETDLGAVTGLSKEALFQKIGTAYPLSYTTGTNSKWFPMMAENDFTREVTNNIKEAWMIFTELQQFLDELRRMSDTLYDNYHLLSGATTLSDTFLDFRQELTEEIMALQSEIREYTNLHPVRIKQSTIYFWTREMREDPDMEDKMLHHLTMDHLQQRVYRLMGMEDSLMEDTNPIGDTCVFHGITADIQGTRVRFAGDVVFGENKVKHVLFNEDGETVSLGYIDHKDGRGQELVFVKSDCSLFRVGNTAWFKEGRYEIIRIGSEEHMDGLKVVKEMLTNIRIEIRPVSTETDSLIIMVTAKDVQDMSLRGDDDHQAVFRVDDNNLLMYLNGYVCGDNFGEFEAKMVCSNLGFSGLEGFQTEQRLPANSAWKLALTTMTNLECPMYATSLDDCTFQTFGDSEFAVCDLHSGVHIVCTNEIIDEQVSFQSSGGEGCVAFSRERQSVRDACTGESANVIAVDQVEVTGTLCASMFTEDSGPFCTVPEGSSDVSVMCADEVKNSDGTIDMSEFIIISTDSVSVVGYVQSSHTFQDDVTVTLEVGDYHDEEIKPLDQQFTYPAFDCTYKGRTLRVTATLENHWCTASLLSESAFNTWDESLIEVLKDDVEFIVTCIAYPTHAPSVDPTTSPSHSPSVSPSNAPTVSPSVSPTTSEPSRVPTSSVPSQVPTPTPESYMVVKGEGVDFGNFCNDPSNSCDTKPDFEHQKHAVRCCLDSQVDSASMGFLGWVQRDSCPYPTVWAKSEFADECHVATWSEARSICESLSYLARLCSAEELEAGCAGSSGCDYDYRLIWSSTSQEAYEPYEATLEPTASTSEPTASTSEPTATTSEPTASTSEPTASTSEPTASTLEPTPSTSEPTPSTEEPTAGCEYEVLASGAFCSNHMGFSYTNSLSECFELLKSNSNCYQGPLGPIIFYQAAGGYGACYCSLGECLSQHRTSNTNYAIYQEQLCHKQFYVAKGRPNTGCSLDSCDTVAVDPLDVYPVRCCADSALSGWDDQSTREPGVCSNWAAADIFEEGCQELNWADANDFCNSKGGRLCTLEEVEQGCARSTGCDFDDSLVWTSTSA